MPNQRHYPRASLEASNAKLAADTREIINKSLKLLQEGPPDTFLGRQTYEPFPQATDEFKK